MSNKIISGERSLTYDALHERAARAATALDRFGIKEDDTIALLVRNDFVFFEAAAAANLIGAYAVPINWHFKDEEVGYIIADCGAKVLVGHADLLAGIADGIPAGVQVLAVPTPPEIRAAYGISDDAGAVPAGATDWYDWIADREPWTAPPLPPRTNMIYTSGTTGRPKGVHREPASEQSAAKMAEMVTLCFGFRPGTQFNTVITGPVYHSAPNFYALWAAREGGLVVLQPRFDPVELLAIIETHRITHMHIVPTMFVRLLKLPEGVRASCDVSSLEFVVHGAAPCPVDVKRRMIDWWGPVIYEYYGATETGIVVFNTSEQALAKPGTVGTVLPGGTVRVRGADDRALPPGEIGEIYLWLDGWPDFTYHGKDESRRAIDWDGLVTVGDVGYVDDDGCVFLCDRKNDMVISGGVNIYPAEIEAVLIDMPGVHDCAVFGIPDPEFGERLCAYVELEAGARPEAEAVRAHLGRHLANYKVPRVIAFRSALPREDSGKIFKRKLRAPYWQGLGRSI